MKVSVITISFKDLDGIDLTARSVAEQKLPADTEIEHLVVDAGTPDFHDRFPAAPSTWTSARDEGRYDGMNRGFERSTGDLIWWMHSGDVFGSDQSVAQAVRALGSASDARWGFGMARLVDQGGVAGILGTYPFSSARFSLGGQPVPHQASFFTRAMVSEIGGYSLTHGLAADQRFILEASMRSSPVFVPEFLCNFDTSGAGSVRPPREHFRDMRRAVRDVGYKHPRGRVAGYVLSRGLQMTRSFNR